MNLSDKVIIPAQVMARDVGGETIILNLETGTYFGLDNVGARIWELLGAGKALTEICDAIVNDYDVSRDVAERDMLALIRDLQAQKLVEPV